MTTPAVQAVRRRWQELEGTMRKSLECALALGKELVALKETVPHGQFGRYFQDSKDPVQDPLPFTRKWAFKLMTAARNDVLANVNHARHLPADINTIGELATLPQPALEAAIESGRITPDLTRAEAKALKREISPKAVVEKPKPTRDDVWFECRNTISDTIDSAIALFPDLDWEIKSHINHISRTLERAYNQRRKNQAGNPSVDSSDRRGTESEQ
jgi:hypothetical protein